MLMSIDPLIWCMRRVLDICGILSQNPKYQSDHERTSVKLRNILQNTWPVQIINAGEGIEEREHSYTVGRNMFGVITMENRIEVI